MAKRANHIFPECYVDTNILKTFLCLDGVNHKHGCSNVMAGMKIGRFADGFALERTLCYLQSNQYDSSTDELVKVFNQ